MKKPFYWIEADGLKEHNENTYATMEETQKAIREYTKTIDFDNVIKNGRDKNDVYYADIMKELYDFNGKIKNSEYVQSLTLEKLNFSKKAYSEVVSDKVLKEFNEFKAEMLEKSSLEVFNEFYKIHFYSEIAHFISSDEDYLSEDEYRALNNGKLVLEGAYLEFLSKEEVSINNYGDTEEFLRGYIKSFYYEEMQDYESQGDEELFYAYLKEHNIVDEFDENQEELFEE